MNLSKFIKEIPKTPGVYKFIDSNNQIIYIGKAKKLQDRIKSYFNDKKQGVKTKVLVSKINKIDFIEVKNELEAFILEINLIKEHKPKYNIIMKDDKNFSYIKINTEEEYPKIHITRKKTADNAIYFGPKLSQLEIKETLKVISALLTYPNCQINYLTDKQKTKSHFLCSYKKIDPDHTPCINDLDKKEYQKIIEEIILFLKGNQTKQIKKIQDKMQQLAESKQFEQAVILRNRLFHLQNFLKKQTVSNVKVKNADVISVLNIGPETYITILSLRNSKLIEKLNFHLSNINKYTENEVMYEFIKQHYHDNNNKPQIIYSKYSIDAEKNKEIKTVLNIQLHQTIRGEKTLLLKLAEQNNRNYYNKFNRKIETLTQLKDLLQLEKIPKRIECFDISHLNGEFTIASMVVFKEGEPSTKDYRFFKIRTLKENEINDYQSIYEVINRRLKYIAAPKNYKITSRKNKISINSIDNNQNGFLTFTNSQKTTIIDEIEATNKNIFKLLLEKLITSSNAKKIFISKQINYQINVLEEVGFIPIKHSEYEYAYYKSKQHIDESFSTKPHLIVIDGGKGQLSLAKQALAKFQVEIPIISIAKKNEILFYKKTQIILEKQNTILKLIQHLRDEAHRFAITQNRKSRQNQLFK